MTVALARVKAALFDGWQHTVSLSTRDRVQMVSDPSAQAGHFSQEHIKLAVDELGFIASDLQQVLHEAPTPVRKMRSFDLKEGLQCPGSMLSANDPTDITTALHLARAFNKAPLSLATLQNLSPPLLKAAMSLYGRWSLEALEQLLDHFSPSSLGAAMHSVLGSLDRSRARQATCQGKPHTAAQVLAAGPAEEACLGLVLSQDTTLPSLFLHVNIRQEPPILSAHITAVSYLWQSLRGNTTLRTLDMHITGFSALGHDTPLADQLFPRLMASLANLLCYNSTLRHVVIRGGGRHAPQRQEDLESLREAAAGAPLEKRLAIACAFSPRSSRTMVAKLPHHLMQRILDEAVPLAPCVVEFVKH